jgi:hypothetical protein
MFLSSEFIKIASHGVFRDPEALFSIPLSAPNFHQLLTLNLFTGNRKLKKSRDESSISLKRRHNFSKITIPKTSQASFLVTIARFASFLFLRAIPEDEPNKIKDANT